jgi:hypothetical protein
MTKQQIKQQTDRTWDFVTLLSNGLGGAMLAFSETYKLGYFLERDFYFSQIVGAILITMFCYRVWTLHKNEVK